MIGCNLSFNIGQISMLLTAMFGSERRSFSSTRIACYKSGANHKWTWYFDCSTTVGSQGEISVCNPQTQASGLHEDEWSGLFFFLGCAVSANGCWRLSLQSRQVFVILALPGHICALTGHSAWCHWSLIRIYFFLRRSNLNWYLAVIYIQQAVSEYMNNKVNECGGMNIAILQDLPSIHWHHLTYRAEISMMCHIHRCRCAVSRHRCSHAKEAFLIYNRVWLLRLHLQALRLFFLFMHSRKIEVLPSDLRTLACSWLPSHTVFHTLPFSPLFLLLFRLRFKMCWSNYMSSHNCLCLHLLPLSWSAHVGCTTALCKFPEFAMLFLE